MWYIFPQIDGLGFSSTARRYAIKGLDEARAYLDDPVLGPRLLECAEAVVRLEGRSASQVFGSPDDMKLRSCATLFACVSPPGSVFDRLLAKYYQGRRDERTLDLLGIGPGSRGRRRRSSSVAARESLDRKDEGSTASGAWPRGWRGIAGASREPSGRRPG